MAAFTISYRLPSGGLKSEVIDAADRASALAQMKARGITPVSVKEGGTIAAAAKVAAKQPAWIKGAIAGLVVVIAAVIAFFCLMPTEKPAAPKVEKPKKVKVEKPAPRPRTVVKPLVTNAAPVVEAPKPIDPNARPTKVGEEINGYIKLPSGRLHKVKGVVTNSVSQTTRGWYSIFPHHCDNEIACYLTIVPGTPLLGNMKYNGRFRAEFIKSLETPIIVYEDDPEEVKELKRNVREAKINLKAAMDRGEDIEQIMRETREELQDLGRYKMDLERQLRELNKEKPMSVDDLQLAVDAANRMLEAKGIAPMKFGPLVRQKMLLEMQKGKGQMK